MICCWSLSTRLRKAMKKYRNWMIYVYKADLSLYIVHGKGNPCITQQSAILGKNGQAHLLSMDGKHIYCVILRKIAQSCIILCNLT